MTTRWRGEGGQHQGARPYQEDSWRLVTLGDGSLLAGVADGVEQLEDNRIFRPEQVYVGAHGLAYAPLAVRGEPGGGDAALGPGGRTH